jgi:hypothetical protein
MQSFRLLSAIAAGAALVSGAAMAAPPSSFSGKATLASPAAPAKEAVVSGVAWKCEGADCAGVAERYSSIDGRMKECKKVVAALGPLSAYQSRGIAMSKGDLSVCNKAAAGVETAQTAAPNGN